eukprot:GHVS01045091.1.p1 GENE.GHVS01045091.1~~GHVS01045091.1.p1  ORF type:complete len:120 (-),score=7.02 GHVS01045091.1:274-633(-)
MCTSFHLRDMCEVLRTSKNHAIISVGWLVDNISRVPPQHVHTCAHSVTIGAIRLGDPLMTFPSPSSDLMHIYCPFLSHVSSTRTVSGMSTVASSRDRNFSSCSHLFTDVRGRGRSQLSG